MVKYTRYANQATAQQAFDLQRDSDKINHSEAVPA